MRSAGTTSIASVLPCLALYGALYSSFGAASPFMPSFMESRGIGPEWIGLIFAVSTGLRLIAAPGVGHLADRFRSPRLTLAICCMAAAAVGAAYLPVSTFLAMVVIALLHAATLAPVTTLADALALQQARGPPAGRIEYGWVRGAGSAAFILGTMGSGFIVAAYGLDAVIAAQCLLLLGAPLCLLFMPRPQHEVASATPSSSGSLGALLRMPAFCRIVLISGLVFGSHALHDTFAIIRWREAGIDARTISLLWSAAVASEVLVFLWLGPRLLARVTPQTAIGIAALAGALRWGVAAITVDPIPLALIQPLHGLTFALLHLASMRLLARILPPSLTATGLALYGTIGAGVAGALVTLASGWLYASMGSKAFLVMSALCLAALPLTSRVQVEVAR